MAKPYVTLLGKSIKKLAGLRGGGSALPGLVIEKIDPQFVSRTLTQLPRGVVIVSGTNGKTTTTKMVVELFESQGLKVFTNRTGSNFVRGVIAALLGEIDVHGQLDADIAVLELDEAHAVHFVRAVTPRYSLLLNVMRDQLDRFGEIDTTARMLAAVASATSQKVVINREDPRLLALGKKLPVEKTAYFGLSPSLRTLFPSDENLRSDDKPATAPPSLPKAVCTLNALHDHTATFSLNGKSSTATLKLDGIYNIFNAAAALALVSEVMAKQLNRTALLATVSQIAPAFGRGETVMVNEQPVELVLVKNPSGFRLGLKSFSPSGCATMIAINDNYADGRDMSWLWDVDFDSLRQEGVAMISGIRAYDMALRLQYDEVTISEIELNLADALKQFLAFDAPKRIYCTYTAMLTLRRELSKITEVESVK